MIKHVFTLVWNRKRTNVLIVAEVLISFLVVCAVLVLSVNYLAYYIKPLGFDYQDVWSVDVSTSIAWARQDRATVMNTTRRLTEIVRNYPEVVEVSVVQVTPFGSGVWMTALRDGTIPVMYEAATDELPEVLNLKLIQGRWFDRTDDGQSWNPVVINASLRDELFGDEDPIGQVVEEASEKRKEARVVGVLDDFRLHGELRPPFRLYLGRVPLDDTTRFRESDLLVRVRPGTTVAFEERLMAGLTAAAPGWSFHIQPLSTMRKGLITETCTPLALFAVVAGFLMLMVGFGLLGVLWQNVTRRTAEIGLRRALGAQASSIYLQVLAEILVVATIGVALGTLIVIQFPLLGIDPDISVATYVIGLLLSMGIIYSLTAVCGLYPSWLASRIGPAAALHYE
ncbi:MAG TPA: ABC transporter permease [Acidobacteriota bacterium]|nr:ABC transporter permease [Acidobacteriota bacterium]